MPDDRRSFLQIIKDNAKEQAPRYWRFMWDEEVDHALLSIGIVPAGLGLMILFFLIASLSLLL